MGGVRGFGPTGRDQTHTPQGEPTFRKGGGAKGGGKGVGAPGAGVGRVRFEEVAGAEDGLDAAGTGEAQDPLLVGPVLSQRDQPLNASKMLAEVLGPVVGAQVVGSVEGLLPQKPPVPVTPTHAEMTAWLCELPDTENRLSKKVEKAKGRLEKARAKVSGGGGGGNAEGGRGVARGERPD